MKTAIFAIALSAGFALVPYRAQAVNYPQTRVEAITVVPAEPVQVMIRFQACLVIHTSESQCASFNKSAPESAEISSAAADFVAAIENVHGKFDEASANTDGKEMLVVIKQTTCTSFDLLGDTEKMCSQDAKTDQSSVTVAEAADALFLAVEGVASPTKTNAEVKADIGAGKPFGGE